MSCFAEYATVSRRSVVPIARDMPLDIAALMGCAVLTGAGAVFNGGDVKPGGTVAVVGLGGVGLAAVLGAVAAGAETIVAVDRIEAKLETARDLGATHLFRADDPDVVAKVREATKGGVETALEFAGVAKALELAYAITRRGGVTVTAGLPNPKAMLSLPAVSLVAEERTLKGSYLGSGVPSRDIPRFLALHRRGKLPVEKLLTHRLKLDEINLGFDRLNDRRRHPADRGVLTANQTPSSPRYSSAQAARSLCFITLPPTVSGSASTKTIFFGVSKPASPARAHSISSCSSHIGLAANDKRCDRFVPAPDAPAPRRRI